MIANAPARGRRGKKKKTSAASKDTAARKTSKKKSAKKKAKKKVKKKKDRVVTSTFYAELKKLKSSGGQEKVKNKSLFIRELFVREVGVAVHPQITARPVSRDTMSKRGRSRATSMGWICHQTRKPL